jgi:hypothetical protein
MPKRDLSMRALLVLHVKLFPGDPEAVDYHCLALTEPGAQAWAGKVTSHEWGIAAQLLYGPGG